MRGFVSAGSWGRTWYEHMLELERRRLTAEGKSPSEVNAAVKAFADFYNLYLIRGMTPGRSSLSIPNGRACGMTHRMDNTAARQPFTSNCRRSIWAKPGKK